MGCSPSFLDLNFLLIGVEAWRIRARKGAIWAGRFGEESSSFWDDVGFRRGDREQPFADFQARQLIHRFVQFIFPGFAVAAAAAASPSIDPALLRYDRRPGRWSAED